MSTNLLRLFSIIAFILISFITVNIFSEQYYNNNWTIADQCGPAYKNEISLVEKLQKAIKRHYKKLISKLISYPMDFYIRDINAGKLYTKHQHIQNKDDFIKNYDLIFNPETKKKILRQNPKNLFCNYRGTMIADETVWLNGGIFEINITREVIE